ncbi:MAG: sulfatase-like hydrolase/transferase, partial [Bacteroidetes bacterium]|nr:sulfatase-like hydrolase/transferase [Bacteroidota bacterium]
QAYLSENPVTPIPDTIAVRPPWKPFRDHARIWLNAEALPGGFYDKDDIGTYYSKQAIDFIDQNMDQRFCLWLGFHEPHSPFNFPIEYKDRTVPSQISLAQGSEEDDRWIPEVFSDLTEKEKKGITAAYYNSVEYLDKNVGMVIDHLEQKGLLEKTLIIYLGDHGYLLNHHKRFEKHTMWEEAVNAPLIIQANGRYGKNSVSDQLTEFVDLAPTILEALGMNPMDGLQGKSLIPLISGQTNQHKSQIFSEFLADNKVMIRTNRWKYIYTSGKQDLAQGYATGKGPSGVVHRLYDLENDPGEMTNLAAQTHLKDTVRQLQGRIIEHFRNTHPLAGKIPDNLEIEDQLSAFCEPPEGGDMDAK